MANGDRNNPDTGFHFPITTDTTGSMMNIDRQKDFLNQENPEKEEGQITTFVTELGIEMEVIYEDGKVTETLSNIEVCINKDEYNKHFAEIEDHVAIEIINNTDGTLTIRIDKEDLNEALEKTIKFVPDGNDGFEIREYYPPFETEDFDLEANIFSGNVFKVDTGLSREELDIIVKTHFNLDTDDEFMSFGDHTPSETFEIEGVDGVIMAIIYHIDEYRGNFGGWIQIKGIKGSVRGQALGRIQLIKPVETHDEESGGFEKKTILKGEHGDIQFGTYSNDEYYPHGFCKVEL